MGEAPDNKAGWSASSARELLEQLCHGHSREVEAILRFADEHRLHRDDLVFLLVSILKVNEALVRALLEAAECIDRAIQSANASAKQLNALAQQLVAQIEAAANRAAGPLNLAADRLTSTVQQAEKLTSALAVVGRDFRSTRAAVEKLTQGDDSSGVIDGMHHFIAMEARKYLEKYGAEVMYEMKVQLRRDGWFRHIYGIFNVGVVVIMVIWAARH